MNPFPVRVMIEPSGVCNIHCLTCFNSDPRVEKKIMTPEVFRGITPIFPHIKEIISVGNGEPFLNPHILEFFGEAKGHGLSIRAYTNGQLMTEEGAARLVDLGVEFLNFSVDAWEPELYETLRPGARFEKLESAIEMVFAAKKRQKRDFPRLWFNMVGTNRNFHQLPALLRAAHRYHAEKVAINFLQKTAFMDASLGHPSEDVVRETFREALPLARSMGVNLSFPAYLRQSKPEWGSYRPDYWRQMRYLAGIYQSKRALARQIWDKVVFQYQRLSPRVGGPLLGKMLGKNDAGALPKLYRGCPVEFVFVNCAGNAATCCKSLDFRWGNVTEVNLRRLWEETMLPALNEEILNGKVSHCSFCGRRLSYLGL